MKKIGIITITDYNNYGNRLQNYAVQEVLSSLDFEVETIKTKHPSLNKSDKSESIKCVKLISLFRKILIFIVNKVSKRHFYNRYNKFVKFSKANITETEYYLDDNNIPDDIDSKYDYIVIGSDQIWNPTFRYGSSIDFATFASKEKRIAYAPSFGISEIPKEYILTYKKLLSEVAYLSVREDAGAKIIKELVGREAQVLIDPTLMLNRGQWLSLAIPSKSKPKHKFLLTYLLGEKTAEQIEVIDKIRKDNNMDIIALADIKDKKRFDIDPSEFIDYINSAQILITDSFHGVIFSILLERPFVVFRRNENTLSMNSRIDTLLSKFKFEDRRWENIKNRSNIFDIDFSHVPEILELERNKALDYLKNALDVKDKE